MKFIVFVLPAALLIAAQLAYADDRKRIAILDFEGPHGASVRGAVMRIAAAKTWVASPSKLDGRSVREFARDHEVDIVVDGTVEKRDHAYEIRIRFLRGTTGRAITSTSTIVKEPMLDRSALRRVELELDRALSTVSPRANDSATANAEQP